MFLGRGGFRRWSSQGLSADLQLKVCTALNLQMLGRPAHAGSDSRKLRVKGDSLLSMLP